MTNINTSESQTDFDVIIVGAGISGVNAAYRIQTGLPDYSYTILESRDEIGGTWSLFKYPGIRSDSDLYTFGFAFDPWTEDKAIAPAASILSYLHDVADRHGIAKNIKFQHTVGSLDWRSDEQKWRIEVLVNNTEKKIFYTKFVVMGTGYYDYKKALPSQIPGIENFQGTVVHPQFWPAELDYSDKKVVIIGSGATAVTLLPAMCENGAAKVTMLQRSPGYFVCLPSLQPINNFIRKWFPTTLAHKLIRMRFLIQSFAFFYYCRWFPKNAIQLLRNNTEKELPPHIPVDPHFIPAYRPWQQRMCISPDGDFFEALRSGKGDIATGHIDTVTRNGVRLKSGQFLDADIVITATGLSVQLCGNATLSVDGQEIHIGDKLTWRGAMLQDVPNLAFIFGYTNASWTLGSDATARLFVRILKDMKKRGMTSTVPFVKEPDKIQHVDMLNLNSTYIQAAVSKKQFPKGGDVAPWKPRRSYFVDSWFASFGDIATGLVSQRVSK